MNNTRNNDRELVEEVESKKRTPITCTDCGDVADGMRILGQLVENNEIDNPWICPSCEAERGESG
jgi:rubrerythrin